MCKLLISSKLVNISVGIIGMISVFLTERCLAEWTMYNACWKRDRSLCEERVSQFSHLVWCLDKPAFRTWTYTQFWQSDDQDKDTLNAPRHFEGHEEHWVLNFLEHCLLTDISVCHLPLIHTRLFPCFWGRIACLTSPDLICPHEMSCWFICIARHHMSAALVPLSDLSNNSICCNRDISFLLFCPSASFQHVPYTF